MNMIAWRKPRLYAFSACFVLIAASFHLAGCVEQDPEWANKMAMEVGAPRPDAAVVRETQTAFFHDVSEQRLLIAGTQVLQDLGFTIEESAPQYGMLAGSKDRSAVEADEVAGQIALTIGLALLGAHYNPTWDQDQVIRATLTTRPVEDAVRMRISFERIVTTNTGVSRAEELDAPEFSTGFFERVRSGLAKSGLAKSGSVKEAQP